MENGLQGSLVEATAGAGEGAVNCGSRDGEGGVGSVSVAGSAGFTGALAMGSEVDFKSDSHIISMLRAKGTELWDRPEAYGKG